MTDIDAIHVTNTGTEPKKPEIGKLSAKYYDRLMAHLSEVIGPEAAIPAVFLNRRPRVLKIGILEDLQTRFPAADPKALKDWVARWTRCHQYHEAVAYRNHRHDLDGNDVSDILEAHRTRAKAVLEIVRAKAPKKPKASQAPLPAPAITMPAAQRAQEAA
jgi:sRNA-binding protein